MARSTLVVLASLALLAPAGRTQDQPDRAGDESDRVERLEQRVEQLDAAYRRLMGVADDLARQLARLQGNPRDAGDEFYIPRSSAEFADSGQPAELGNVYTKPFLSRFGQDTYVGGYIDLEYSDVRGDGASKEFDQHRFVPFFYSDVSDRVKVAAELEIEHGSELEVEFAQMDFLLTDAFNLRAGIQLLPLGKLNEVHDSPIQELTNRPLVDTFIIPTTLRDAGVGAWGDLGESVSYQATITNGFRGLDATGKSTIDNKTGLRNAAPFKDKIGEPFDNTNDKLAYTGRVAVKPLLGTEFGISALKDSYDEAGDNDLTIWALDATVDGKAVPGLPDNVELFYERAAADVERDLFAKASGVAGDMTGHYVQANVHIQPDFLEAWRTEGFVDEGAQFNFVTRYGRVDLDDYIMRRTTIGLNFRPNASETVFKLDYQFNDDAGANRGTHDADALLFSFASYF